MQTQNVFHKGISDDLDYTKVGPDEWVFPTQNICVMNNEGQGYIIVTKRGNTGPIDATHLNGEEFKLSQGFRVVGACEYKGILYIASYNNNTNKGELGCFPSPNSLDCLGSNGGLTPSPIVFERKYRAFNNYTYNDPIDIDTFQPSDRQIFRTEAFNYSMDRRVEMLTKESYDGSIDIYFTDFHNANRVINSGFRFDDGSLVTRIYNDDSFSGSMFNTSYTGLTTIDLQKVDTGGTLKHGSYIFYIRYRTLSLDTTGIIAISNQVIIPNTKNNGGGEYTGISDKRVVLRLYNIDTSYDYYEILYTRFFGDTNSNTQLSEYKLIDPPIPLDKSNSYIDIIITGTETVIDASFTDVSEIRTTELVCKTQTQIDNVWFGGNWKGLDRRHPDLVTASLSVIPTVEVHEIDGETLDKHFMEANNSYNYVSYFETEIYPFAIVYEMKDGNFSEAYPITGIDFYGSSLSQNNLGFVKFPKRNNINNVLYSNGKSRLFCIKFDITQLRDTMKLSPWIKANVRSFFFVRGDRNKNLVYQGLSFHTSIPNVKSTGNTTFPSNYEEFNIRYNNSWRYLNPSDSMCAAQNGRLDNSNFQYILHPALCKMHNLPVDLYWGKQQIGNDYDYDNNTDISKDPGDMLDADGRIAHTNNFNSFPLFRGYMPMTYQKGANKDGQNADKIINYTNRWWAKLDRLAFYAFDYMFDPIAISETIEKSYSNLYIERTGYVQQWDNGTLQTGILAYNKVSPWFTLETVKDYIPYLNDDAYALSGFKDIGGGIGTPIGCSNSNSNDMCNIGFDYWTAKWFEDNDPKYTRNDVLFSAFKLPSALLSAFSGFTSQGISTFVGFPNEFQKEWTSRNIYAKNYIGLSITKCNNLPVTGNNNYENVICNLYKADPNTTLPTTSISGIAYKAINQRILISDVLLDSSAVYYTPQIFNGDCFVQMTYFKQTGWFSSKMCEPGSTTEIGSDISKLDSETTPTFERRFAHGVILGVVTSNSINTAMRHESGTGDNIYPTSSIPNDLKFAISSFETTAGQEEFMYNPGYNHALPQRIYDPFRPSVPYTSAIYPTRIRYSAMHIPYSIIDGYRILDIAAYKDFDLAYGHINRIVNFKDNLFSIQDDTINRHYVGLKDIKTPTTAGELVIGRQDEYLNKEVQRLGNFGSQHQFSVGVYLDGIYGWDFKRKIIWTTATSNTLSGITFGASPLSEGLLIRRWLTELQELIEQDRSDKLYNLDDNTLNGIGIHSGYDYKNKEVLFTLSYTTNYVNGVFQIRPYTYSKTIAFNQRLKRFIGEYSFTPNMYMNIYDELLSQNTYQNTISGVINYTDNIFLHDRKDSNYLTFYGQRYPMLISYIVNNRSGSNAIKQLYLGKIVEGSHTDYWYVDYKTEYQTSKHDWINDAFDISLLPEYLEHSYRFPIKTQDSLTDDAFSQYSNMRGSWLRTTIAYDGDIECYIKNVITNYIQSNS